MDKIKTTLLHFGRPNENGKIYSNSDFDTTSTVLVMVDKHNAIGMKFLEQVGTADITKNADTLEAEIHITGDHKEHALEKIEAGEKFVVDGSGYIEESGYIRNYKLMRIIITNDTKNFYLNMSTIITQNKNTICIFSEAEAIYITKTGWDDYHVIFEYGDTGNSSYRRMSEFELNEKYGIVANILLLNNTNDTRTFN